MSQLGLRVYLPDGNKIYVSDGAAGDERPTEGE
jgi:hypothetical protein